MANVDAPFGFRPYRHMKGGVIRTTALKDGIASGYDTNIFKGDVVERVADGTIEIAEAGNVDNLAVFAGCQYTDSGGNPVWSQYWPADTVATDIIAYMYTDPEILFECQFDTLAAAARGNMCDWVVGSGGNTATGISSFEAEGSALATTGKSLYIWDISDRSDNESGANAKGLVMFAEHVLARVVSGVGGI